jgi:hypothetical protein
MTGTADCTVTVPQLTTHPTAQMDCVAALHKTNLR